MSGHTKYPWKNDGTYISDATGLCIDPNVMGGEEVARRIVACVNACAGIETEIIERNVGNVWKLLQQRDELLEATKELLLLVDDFMPNIGKCCIQNYQRLNEAPLAARAAIAQAEAR